MQRESTAQVEFVLLMKSIESEFDMKNFDLNMGKILEDWEIYHAIREIIANALDEQLLTNTAEIEIAKAGDAWCIRDFGRGLNYHHLTQNENPEKTDNDKVIGRFGVGLKDALATLFRHNIVVEIQSKYGVITLKESTKNTVMQWIRFLKATAFLIKLT